MTNDDNLSLMARSDVPAALGLLSRLPVRVDIARATARGAKAAWAYPVAGLVVGIVACSIAQIALTFGLPSPLVAGLTLAVLVIITGAMHEDGLADSADGLWGGWDKAKRLEIMKDSHIGAYGVIALILSLGLRWQALTLIIAQGGLWPAVIATAMLSRAAIVPLMTWLPHSRDTGLSQSVGKPSANTAFIAVGIGLCAALFLWQLIAVLLILAASGSVLACATIARSKIDGQTGDILGATQQITELAILLTLAMVLT